MSGSEMLASARRVTDAVLAPELASSLRAQAASLRAAANELEEQAAALEGTGLTQADELLTLAQLTLEFRFSRESLATAAREGLPVHRGPRGKLCAFRRDVETWVRSRAWSPRLRVVESVDDALARAERELLAADGFETCVAQPKSAGCFKSPENGGPRR